MVYPLANRTSPLSTTGPPSSSISRGRTPGCGPGACNGADPDPHESEVCRCGALGREGLDPRRGPVEPGIDAEGAQRLGEGPEGVVAGRASPEGPVRGCRTGRAPVGVGLMQTKGTSKDSQSSAIRRLDRRPCIGPQRTVDGRRPFRGPGLRLRHLRRPPQGPPSTRPRSSWPPNKGETTVRMTTGLGTGTAYRRPVHRCGGSRRARAGDLHGSRRGCRRGDLPRLA